MGKQSWAKWVLLGVVLSLARLPMYAQECAASRSAVSVAVHDSARVPESTLLEAERVASLIFRRARLDVEFVNCGPTADDAGQSVSFCRAAEFPRHLQLSIARRSKNLTDSIFGISFLGEDGSGCYSDVFLEPALELRDRLQFDLPTLLGHVIAHEIAHLLLGTNAHSGDGIMRPRWNDQDVQRAGKGELLFSAGQGQTMREKVSTALCRPAGTAIAAARRN